MKNILIPTDFSKQSNHAIDFAIQCSRIFAAEITIIHVFELKGRGDFYKPLLDNLYTQLSVLKDNIKEQTGIIVQTDLYEGNISESIVQATHHYKIDLIVMGTLGNGGIRERLLGSETARIIGKSEVPVLVIPINYQWKKTDKILLATHHFEQTPYILDFLFELTELFAAEMHISVFSEEDDAEAMIQHAKRITTYEKILQDRYANSHISATHLIGTDFKKAILDHINQNKIDLLVMNTYKREDVIDAILNPSITKAMSYCTEIPLLAIPVQEENINDYN